MECALDIQSADRKATLRITLNYDFEYLLKHR